MTYQEFFIKASSSHIPLADIRVIFDGYFRMPFDSIAIHGNEKAEGAEEVLERLKEGYPANYLAGYIDILSLHLFLNESTLIPRNETAYFVHDDLFQRDFQHKKILDLCTGSGLIAIAMKKHFPDADVYASDISEDALQIARKNAEYNETDIHFLHSDYLKTISDTFDVIICNPPYIEEGSKDVDAPFEPALALYSGKDGLDSFRSIFNDLTTHLNPGGEAYFELESTNAENTLSLFHQYNQKGFLTKLIRDCYGRNRFLSVKSIG